MKYQQNRQLWAGLIFYAAGFPNWQWHDEKTIENTRNWGLKAFHLTRGRLVMQLDRPLEAGYQLGYTNNIESGMSGGPILDVRGYLVGINGRLKYPLGGIETFRFMDGTLPSWSEFKQMERLSWGIPIETIFPGSQSDTHRRTRPCRVPTGIFSRFTRFSSFPGSAWECHSRGSASRFISRNVLRISEREKASKKSLNKYL